MELNTFLGALFAPALQELGSSPLPERKGQRLARSRQRMQPLTPEAQKAADARTVRIRAARALRWLRNQADDSATPPGHIWDKLREAA